MSVNAKAAASRNLCLALIAAWCGYLLPFQILSSDGNLVRWSVQCVPLLLFAVPLWRRRPRAAIWLCLLLLLYFAVLSVNLFAPGDTLHEIVSIALISALFVCSMLFARWQSMASKDSGSPHEHVHPEP